MSREKKQEQTAVQPLIQPQLAGHRPAIMAIRRMASADG